MSATLVAHRAAAARPNGGAPARRALTRWAWRMFRREWRQQLLVLSLIIIAVTATIVGAAVATNSPPPKNAGFGTADHLVLLPPTDAQLSTDIASIAAQFGGVDVVENQNVATGLAQGAVLRAQDPNGRYGSPMLALRSGRFPSNADEVSMSTELAAAVGMHVGDVWSTDARAWRVVGLVENPENLLERFGLVAAGTLDAPSQVVVLFDATSAAATAFAFPNGANAVTPHASNGIAPAIIVFAIATVGLLFVGLVAVSGFSVLAQRRLRALGMVSAIGATDRHVRWVVVVNGAIVGIVGASIGALIGLTAWIAYAPHLTTIAHHRIRWTNLPWWLVIVVMLLAFATATLASQRPARALARTPIVAALSGRPASAKGVHRSAIPAVAIIIFGLLLLASSGGWGANGGRNVLFQLGGLLACAIGLLLLSPLAVAALGVGARRAPVAVRIAWRDLARYRARSGAALAAVSLATLIAVLIALIATGRFADPFDYFGPNVPANQLLIYPPDANRGPGPAPTASSPVPDATQLEAGATAVSAAVDSHDVLALETADVMLAKAAPGGVFRSSTGVVYVATPELLAHYGIDPGTIDPATTLITSRAGLAGTTGLRLLRDDFFVPGGPANGIDNPRIQTVHNLPTVTALPNLLVTEHAVTELGLDVHPGAWLVTAQGRLSATQINVARQTAAAAAMTIETRNQAPSLTQLRDTATAVGILFALGVLSMTVGLLRSETGAERRTLTAVGAPSTTRRTITAATAGGLALVGALLGTAVAYIATAAFFRNQLSQRMSHPPTLDLLLVLVGLPVAAILGGWVFAGREPPAIGRKPIE